MKYWTLHNSTLNLINFQHLKEVQRFGAHMPLLRHLDRVEKFCVSSSVLIQEDGTISSWLRLSGQVYNSMEDFKRLGESILKLSKE